ncbi:HEAT repeat domain-containing protein [Nocardia sp. NPDC004568]|uniref:HEAT repeat domain-containing protein n=1 Tax=Nocardia sp. NPDC004568 TaxID=3154551 RepID=UPI0033B03C6F
MVPIDQIFDSPDTRLLEALRAPGSSTRLQAALAAGTNPRPGLVGALIARCAIEPDFYVRDMLTWALTRHPVEITVPAVRTELGAAGAQARSQALHTLSKIGDGSAWPAITRSLLRDADDEVARSAWRAAVVLVPADGREALAAELATQLGRGDRTVQLSLSRALVALGDHAGPAVQARSSSPDPVVRAHARATERLLRDPDAGFDPDIADAKRIIALGPERAGPAAC